MAGLDDTADAAALVPRAHGDWDAYGELLGAGLGMCDSAARHDPPVAADAGTGAGTWPVPPVTGEARPLLEGDVLDGARSRSTDGVDGSDAGSSSDGYTWCGTGGACGSISG